MEHYLINVAQKKKHKHKSKGDTEEPTDSAKDVSSYINHKKKKKHVKEERSNENNISLDNDACRTKCVNNNDQVDSIKFKKTKKQKHVDQYLVVDIDEENTKKKKHKHANKYSFSSVDENVEIQAVSVNEKIKKHKKKHNHEKGLAISSDCDDNLNKKKKKKNHLEDHLQNKIVKTEVFSSEGELDIKVKNHKKKRKHIEQNTEIGNVDIKSSTESYEVNQNRKKSKHTIKNSLSYENNTLETSGGSGDGNVEVSEIRKNKRNLTISSDCDQVQDKGKKKKKKNHIEQNVELSLNGINLVNETVKKEVFSSEGELDIKVKNHKKKRKHIEQNTEIGNNNKISSTDCENETDENRKKSKRTNENGLSSRNNHSETLGSSVDGQIDGSEIKKHKKKRQLSEKNVDTKALNSSTKSNTESNSSLINDLTLLSNRIKTENSVSDISESMTAYDFVQDYLDLSCTKTRLSEDHKAMLKQLHVSLPWPVPASHLIETRMSSHPTKEQKNLFQQLDTKMNTSHYSVIEDKIIMDNWEHFCKVHNLPVDPEPFLSFEAHNDTKMEGSALPKLERINFVRFLAHKLDNRYLFSVYRRFKKLFDKVKKGRFTELEDKIIMEYIQKSHYNNPFSKLALVLNRDRHRILMRYKVLTGK